MLKSEWLMQLWCIHKVKEFESNSQLTAENMVRKERCDVSTKLKNLKATHNDMWNKQNEYNAVMYPQS